MVASHRPAQAVLDAVQPVRRAARPVQRAPPQPVSAQWHLPTAPAPSRQQSHWPRQPVWPLPVQRLQVVAALAMAAAARWRRVRRVDCRRALLPGRRRGLTRRPKQRARKQLEQERLARKRLVPQQPALESDWRP
jgi:hypothetical protein